MKKQMLAVLTAAALSLSMTACSGKDSAPSGESQAQENNAAAQGSSAESGASGQGAGEAAAEIERKDYTVIYAAEQAHINYLVSSLSTCTRFSENYIDALIDFDKYGRTIPCLATDWEVSEDGLVYTFHLREGVNWYTCDGDV